MNRKTKITPRTKWRMPLILLFFLIIAAWFLTGWPVIWNNPRIPAPVQEARADYLPGWGVVAFNPNKSVYQEGEVAYLQMAVLDELGQTVCDADLDVTITYEGTNREKKFSTKAQQAPAGWKRLKSKILNFFAIDTTVGVISRSSTCGELKSDYPDYYAHYTLPDSGVYDIEIVATNGNGTYAIQDTLAVQPSVPFDIERIMPTRIYPPEEYLMTLKIKPLEDYQGEVSEYIPSIFEVAEQGFQVENQNEQKRLVWSVNWRAGKTYELNYEVVFPPQTPDFYELGPLAVGDFRENRAWQIASDVPGEQLENPSFTGGISDWSFLVATYDSTTFQDSAGSMYTYANRKDNFTGIATQDDYDDYLSTDTVTFSCYYKATNVGNGRNQFYADIAEDSTPTNWVNIWDSGISYATFDWTSTGDVDVSGYFSTGTYRLRLRASTIGGAGAGSEEFTWFDNCSLDIAAPPTITVSGGCFTDESEGTPCSDDGSDQIKVAVNGTPDAGADTTVDGSWTFDINEPSSGDILVFYRDGEATESEEATTVIKYDGDGGDVTNVKLYQSQLVIGADSGSTNSDQTITAADLNAGGNGYENSDDEDVLYDYTAGADITVDAEANKSEQLYIISGDTFQPASGGGSDTTTYNLEIDSGAVITADSNAFTVSGSWTNNGTFTANTSTITMSGTGTYTSGGSAANNLTLSGGGVTLAAATHTVAGNLDMGGGSVTATGSTITMIGTSNTIVGGSNTLDALNIDPSSAGTITLQTSDLTVGGTLTVASGDILTITSVNLTHTAASDVAGTGTISGTGTLIFDDGSGGPGTNIATYSCAVRFDASAGNIGTGTFDARTYNGRVEIYSNSATARTATFATSGTYVLSGATSHLYVIAAGDTPGDVTLVGTGNPTVTIGGDLDFTGAGSSAENITSGTGTWTVSGNVNFTDGSYTATAGNTLTMDGTGTLTSNGQTLQNLTINSSNTVTLAAATHTVNGNLVLGGSGTPTVAGSTITMTGTSNTITGGGKTLNILNIDPSSAGTITLQTSNVTIGSTLTVAASDELAIDTVTLTHTDSSDVAGTGNITGSGTLIFDDGSGGPGTNITTLSSAVRFDASGGNVATSTFDARAYGGRVEAYIGSSGPDAARSVALAASTYTISGATSHLYVINDNDTHILTLDGSANPTVSIGGDLDFTGTGASSEAITTGTGTWTVGGNINFTDGDVTFTTGTPDNTFQVNGTSKTITSADEVFRNLSVTGGNISNADELNVAGTFGISASATFTHGTDVDFIATGDGETAFVIADTGTFDSSGAGTGKLILDGVDDDQWFNDLSTGAKQNMGNVQIGQSPGTTKLKSDMAAASLTILDGDTFETHGWDVDLSGALDCQGTCILNLTDGPPSAAGDGVIITFGGNWTMSGSATFTPSTDSRVEPDGTADQTVTTGGKAFYDFYSNNIGASDDVDDVIIVNTFDVDGALTVNDGELDLNTNNPATDVEGNISITSGAELNAPGSLSAAGSWNNNGTFTANSGTVTFDSSAGSETIDAGAQAFNVVVFNHASGDWTIQNDNMTTNSDLTLTAATSFSVASVTLEVKGNLDLSIADGTTTWTGSTLYLNGSGGMYDINTKTHGGDTFITLRIGATEDIAMWDSGATTVTIDSGGCLFSQDHAGSAGRLNIYGTCTSRANEYWSYAKDFEDGAAVTRQADVRFADGASLTVDDTDTLEVIGQNAGANRTLVSRISTGTYGLTISATINAQYYDFDYLNASGLNITSSATVTELSDGSFDNAGAGSASYITVTDINSTDEFRNCVFDDNGDGVDGNFQYNVDADGANIIWKFLWWDGNKGGELYDNEANNAIVDWSENLGFSLSANVMNLGVINPLVIGTDSHNLTVTTNATNGYTCSVVEDGNIRNGANDIDDVSDNTVSVGDEEYGISCADTGDCQLGVNDVALSDTPLTIASNAGRVTASVTPVIYEAAADALTVGATFSHVVTFTCAGDF